MDSRRSSQQRQVEGFTTRFYRLNETAFCGHALWHHDPLLRCVVEMVLDGEPIGLVRAEQFDPELRAAGHGDGCYGFTFVAKKQQLNGQRMLEARIANLGIAVGQPVDLALDAFAPQSQVRAGSADWIGGLRIVGTVPHCSEPEVSPVIRFYDGNALIAETRARRWAAGLMSAEAADVLRFDFHLPLIFADGKPHVIRVTDERGQDLEGSPLTMQAFDDGLRRHIQENAVLTADEPRAKWFDRFLPMSIPFEEYSEWKRRFVRPVEVPELSKSVRVVLIGQEGAEEAVQRLSNQHHRHWSAVAVPSRDGVTFAWGDLKDAVTTDAVGHDVALFVRASTVLREDALGILLNAMAAHEDALGAYCDLEIGSPDGAVQPLFFGAFDYERLLEQGYAAHCFALRIASVRLPEEEATGCLTRLLLALFDDSGVEARRRILHVPGALARLDGADLIAAGRVLKPAVVNHMRQRGVAVEITDAGSPRFPAVQVKRKYDHDGVVSIVIPTRDRVDLLSKCIESIQSLTKRVKYEIVIVDNDSSATETLSYLDARRVHGDRIVKAPGRFNHSHLSNKGVEAARGDFVCLLNNDTEVLASDWLEELLSRIAEPDVGAVAPMLVWPNGMVQNGGIVLGTNFAASDAFNDCMDGDSGYSDLLRVAHETSAVTGACLLTWRHDYLALSGFDEIAFPVLFNDVDFCLRLRAAGKRILFTPHAKLIHHESATRQRDLSYDRASRFRRELTQLRNRWGTVIADDPTYSPFLNLDPYPFSALAWPPRAATPRWNRPVQAQPTLAGAAETEPSRGERPIVLNNA
jgi:GT2 family glycosyltransferase